MVVKEIGVVRKIDELGRIVIPKEIRNTFDILNGDSLEFYIENNHLCLKKYSKLLSFREKAKVFVESFKRIYSMDMLIFDLERVISSSDPRLLEMKYPKELNSKLQNREKYCSVYEETLITGDLGYYSFLPILQNGDLFGSILVFSKQEIPMNSFLFLEFVSNLLLSH